MTPGRRNDILVVASGLTILVGLFFHFSGGSVALRAFHQPSGSMAPTLLPGDLVLADLAAFSGRRHPRRGHLVVFECPLNADLPCVKRVIGVPGDTIQMQDGQIRIGGRRLDEPYSQRTDSGRDVQSDDFAWQRDYLVSSDVASRYRPTRDNWGPLVVPSETYFMLGDNRDNSSDSRYWGFVSRSAILGRLVSIYWSWDKEAGRIRWSRIGRRVR